MKSPFAFTLILPLCTTLFAAEPSSAPSNLANTAAWVEPGAWAMAKEIQGSSQEKKWKSVVPGDAILFNGNEEKAGNLVSKIEHGDAELEVEFMIPKSSNSGIYLMGRYELQILDSYGKADNELTFGDNGGIYERWDDTKPDKEKGFEGTPPSTNASTAPGTWQTFRIRFRAPRFEEGGSKIQNARFVRVEHNGVVIHEDAEVTGPTRGGLEPETAQGPIVLQGDHGPIAIRKFIVAPAHFE